MPSDRKAGEIIKRRHAEWREQHVRWRFLGDSLEGGERYRRACYGQDGHGFPLMNLIRHKREYPIPGRDAPISNSITDQDATDNDFNLRLARTPVPTFVKEAIGKHLSRIYCREVKRQGPDDIEAWWKDVDGRGTTIDEWMADTVAPLILVYGQLDLIIERPEAEPGARVRTRADETALGLKKAVAGYILPDNLLWWKLKADGSYAECLVMEHHDDDEGKPVKRYRHWTAEKATLYDADGEVVKEAAHGYGRVPIIRVFGQKKARCCNIGQSEYEDIADFQREYYNRDSELILSDSIQAHPLFSGPSDAINDAGEIQIGPGHYLPKIKSTSGASPTYEGYEFVDPPKGAAESIRANKQDMRDAVDRSACLAKPAGSAGTGSGVVGQSGKSKEFDHVELNDLLTRRCKTLAKAERLAAGLACRIIRGSDPTEADLDKIEVTYPAEFDLYSADDLAKLIAEIQGTATQAGALPQIEGELLKKLVRLALPGLSDERYEALDAEVDAFLEQQADRKAQEAEASLAGALALAAGEDPGTPPGGDQGPPSDPEDGEPPAPPKAKAPAGKKPKKPPVS